MMKEHADTSSHVDKVAWQHNNAESLDMWHPLLDTGTPKHDGDT
jgi:hypothetical protein